MIEVISVNLGRREIIKDGDRAYETGIYKKPVQHAVTVSDLGLEDDAVCDMKHHGGPDQAVYLYRNEDYQWWSEQLGREVSMGSFGENLTLTGIEGPALNVGDRLRFANLELEITAPRIPCSTLASSMGDKMFAKKFMQAGRPGFYARVISTGKIEVGEEAELFAYSGPSVSTVQFFHEFKQKLSRERLEQYLQYPIDIRSRTEFEQQLSRAI